MSEIRKQEPSPENIAELRARVEKFFSHFHGVIVHNHLNEPVKISLRKAMGDSGEIDGYTLEFDGFSGYSPDIENVNYIRYHVEYNNPPRIIPDFALLTDPRLKSNVPKKGVFPEIIRMFGKYFPKDFEYYAQIENPRTESQLIEVKKNFNNKIISYQTAREQIENNYIIQELFDSGFNLIKITFRGAFIFISAQKIPNHPQEFDVVFGNI